MRESGLGLRPSNSRLLRDGDPLLREPASTDGFFTSTSVNSVALHRQSNISNNGPSAPPAATPRWGLGQAAHTLVAEQHEYRAPAVWARREETRLPSPCLPRSGHFAEGKDSCGVPDDDGTRKAWVVRRNIQPRSGLAHEAQVWTAAGPGQRRRGRERATVHAAQAVYPSVDAPPTDVPGTLGRDNTCAGGPNQSLPVPPLAQQAAYVPYACAVVDSRYALDNVIQNVFFTLQFPAGRSLF
jgi:hypothetical protein